MRTISNFHILHPGLSEAGKAWLRPRQGLASGSETDTVSLWGLGLWMISMALMLPKFRNAYRVIIGPSTYHSAMFASQGWDCMSMQQLPAIILGCFCQDFFIFSGTIFGSPFLDSSFGASYHFKESLTEPEVVVSKIGPRL